jgi:predicted dehydrogenase
MSKQGAAKFFALGAVFRRVVTSFMKLRVGLIGLGDAWDTRHRPALRTLGDRFEVRAVCAEVAMRAEQAAREFGAVAVDGYRALLSRPDIDAVLMLCPQWYGPLPILAACEKGKAVYCAAALDIRQKQAQEVKRRVEESGVAFMAELPRRHYPATLRLKELIATRLGAVRLVFCHERMVIPERSKLPMKNGRPWPMGMRELMEQVDWVRYVVGHEPTSVMGVRHESLENSQDDDYQMLSLDFSPPGQLGVGPLAHISCGRYIQARWHDAVHFRPPMALQVSCEHGVAFFDSPNKLIWFDVAGQHVEWMESERPVGEQLLTQFHRAVTSLLRRTSDLEDAYRDLAVVLTGQVAAREGKRLPLEFSDEKPG